MSGLWKFKGSCNTITKMRTHSTFSVGTSVTVVLSSQNNSSPPLGNSHGIKDSDGACAGDVRPHNYCKSSFTYPTVEVPRPDEQCDVLGRRVLGQSRCQRLAN